MNLIVEKEGAKRADRTLRLHPADNVLVALDRLAPGTVVGAVTTTTQVPRGHKFANVALAEGEPVRKLGQIIGFATAAIAPGEWVHDHNVTLHDFARDYHYSEDAQPLDVLPVEQRATFEGFRRANGKVGTRNYIGILTSVNCSATTARLIAKAAERSGLLDDYPTIDGIIPLVHGTGCGMSGQGEGFDILKRTQWGYAANPNMAAVLMVGLGCEVFQIARMKEEYGLKESDAFRSFTIQDAGGTKNAIEQGLAAIRDMLPAASRRGDGAGLGADACFAMRRLGWLFRSITANPALGAAVDLLVRHGTAPRSSRRRREIYGAGTSARTRRAAEPGGRRERSSSR